MTPLKKSNRLSVKLDFKTKLKEFSSSLSDYVSTDTDEWTNITGILPDVPATAVAIDPWISSNVYAGTDIGVYVSTDGGTTWNDFNDGLPEALIVADLTISPSNRYLRLASHSNGVFERPFWQAPVGVIESGAIVADFRLEQNFPNPFNPTTEIGFGIRDWELVTLKVFDGVGREVATLVNEKKAPGVYSVTWDARNMPSGVYFYQLKAGNFLATRKMLLVK